MLEKTDQDLNVDGWEHCLHFYAYDHPVPGTVKYAVGHAFEPHRMMINRIDEDHNRDGWTHRLSFWAYPTH
jgi:hypothetical protein